jgi:hypothetical protein
MKSRLDKQIDQYNKRIGLEHAKLVEQIIALRPSWDRGKLLGVGHTYGDKSNPGLFDILRSVELIADLESKFGVRS